MIKIETKGLDDFSDTYLNNVKSKVLDMLKKSSLSRKHKNIIINNIDTILIGKKSELDKLFNNKDFFLVLKNARKSIKNKITKIFDYAFIKPELRHHILNVINVKVCPYCGRQFITSYKKGKNIKSTACLDHYYPKSKYPLLSLSLYNFVPSCYVCNSLMKTTKDFYKKKHLYPYEECFGEDATFGLEGFDIITDYIKSDSAKKINSIEIGLNVKDCENKEKINNNIETFKLKDVYQTHDDVVKDLLYKIKLYSPTQISQIANLLKLNEQEVEESIFGKPMDNELLGKLKSDILNQYRGNHNR